MASGDILLDASGNEILDADGNLQLSNGSGDDCCCTIPYTCQACAAACIPTVLKLTWAITGTLDPAAEVYRSGSVRVKYIGSQTWWSDPISDSPVLICPFPGQPSSFYLPAVGVEIVCDQDTGVISGDITFSNKSFTIDWILAGGTYGGGFCSLTATDWAQDDRGTDCDTLVNSPYVSQDCTVTFTLDFEGRCCKDADGHCQKAAANCDDGSCNEEDI